MNNRTIATAALLAGAAAATAQTTVYSHTLDTGGGIHKSAWYPPDGLDGDIRCWDAFRFTNTQTVTQLRWTGGYTNFLSGAGQAYAHAFTIAIWPSIAAGSQPDIVSGPMVEYDAMNNCGETPAGVSIQANTLGVPPGLCPLYTYSYTLPVPFQAQPNVKYWVQIFAWQNLTPFYFWPPDWGLAGAAGGDGYHFRHIYDSGPYQIIQRDLLFSLLGPAPGCYANCDSSTASPVLNVADFTCFLQRFAAGESYANCDQSTAQPVLNVADFTCFLQRFAQGCN
jgi:hypothetical protein